MFERRKAIGYMRVSTPGQATNGLGLVRQRHKILETAERLQLEVVAIYEDTGTAGGPFSDVRLGDLQMALKVARVNDMPIIVSELSRLTRTPSRVDDVILVDGVQIISSKPEETISPASVRAVIDRAHRSRKNISKGTVKGHARRKARGEVSGHVETLEIARQNSLETRKTRASEIVDLVAAALEQHPEYQTRAKTAADVAELLNGMGILSGWRRPFTADGVRSVLRAAKKELENRRLAHEEDDSDVLSPATTQPGKPPMSRKDEEREDLAELDRILGRPVSSAPGAVTAQNDIIDDVDDLADLDLTLSRPEVEDPAPDVVKTNRRVEEFDDLADLDRALELEDAYPAVQAASVSASPTATPQPRKPRPTRSKSSTVPATVVAPAPMVAETPVPKPSTRPVQPVTETVRPTTSAASEEMDKTYKGHPGYKIF